MAQAPATGYSGTPLPAKLGIKPGMRVVPLDAPADYATIVTPWPDGVALGKTPDAKTDLVHLFATERKRLATELARLRERLAPDAMVWVSWPKKSAKVPTDITDDVIREVALPLGWVDVKVCAVDATWSGLKLVVRKALR